MDRFRPRHGYANIVSTICLFLLLGGGAWAATQLPKGSVGTPQLKNGAVTGAKVKNDSLTGADIQAATIGKVPQASAADSATNAAHATSADSAGHADTAGSAGHATSADAATRAGDAATLDGLGADGFYPAGGTRRIDATPAYNGGAQALYSAYGLVLTASCSEGGLAGSTVMSAFATSSAATARIDAGYIEKTGSTDKPVVREHGLDPTTPAEVWTTGAASGNFGQAVGNLVYTDAQRVIDITLESRVSTSGECQISGTAAVSV